MIDNSSETNRLIRNASGGSLEAWNALLQRHRDRLRRMVSLRIDRQLRGWVDPSEVVRQAWAVASTRQSEYLHAPAEAFFLWLRRLAGQRLSALQQQITSHPSTPAEAGGGARELSLTRDATPATSTFALAAQLLGQASAPSQAELRSRQLASLESALNSMDAQEREVLALRHFEQLNNAETAAVLQIAEAEASKLYIRALKKLKEILRSVPNQAGEKPS